MKNNKEDKTFYVPIFMSIGMSIGMAIGAALEAIPIGMCIGVGIGVGVGVLLDARTAKEDDASDTKETLSDEDE